MDETPPIELRNLSATRAFFTGIWFAWRGARVVMAQPGLWGYLFAPITLLLGFFAVFALVSWPTVGWLMGLVWTPSPDANWLLSWMWLTFGVLLRLVLLGGLGLVLYFVAGLVATPFNDRLSDEIERMTLGAYEEPFSLRTLLGDLANSLVHSALSLLIWLTVMICAFFMNVLPVVGSVLSFVIALVATSVFLGRESMDGCMSRRRMSYRHKYHVVLSQFPLVFGFGLVTSGLLWIPFLNFVMLPVSVVGGTLMYCELERQGLVPDPGGRLGYRPIRHRPGHRRSSDHRPGDHRPQHDRSHEPAALADHGEPMEIPRPERERQPLSGGA